MMYSVGDRVYWRSMYGELIAGTIIQRQTVYGSEGQEKLTRYLVQPDGECMGSPYFPHWSDGLGYLKLPRLELPPNDISGQNDAEPR